MKDNKINKFKPIYLVYILVPLCILLVLAFILFWNRSKPYTISNLTGSDITNNSIIINNIEKQDTTGWYCMGGDAITTKELTDSNTSLNNLSIPSDLTNISSYTTNLCGNNNIKKYNLYYQTTDTEKRILISYADNNEALKTLRGYYLNEDNLKESTIDNTKVKIVKYSSSSCFVSFSSKNIFYNLETINIEESNIVSLIESILK